MQQALEYANTLHEAHKAELELLLFQIELGVTKVGHDPLSALSLTPGPTIHNALGGLDVVPMMRSRRLLTAFVFDSGQNSD